MLTTKALALHLGVAPTTIRLWVRRGLIPEVRINSKVRRFDFAAVVEALRNRNAPSTDTAATSKVRQG